MSDVFDIDNQDGDEMLTLDLKKGNNNTYVSGKLLVGITTRGIENDGSMSATLAPPAEFLAVNQGRSSSRGSRERVDSENPPRKTSPSRLSADGSNSGTDARRRRSSSTRNSFQPSQSDEEPLPPG